jgi:hypothetical protein
MSDNRMALAFISTSQDKAALTQIVENARRKGAAEVEAAAFKKLIAIVPEALPGSLEHDFWTTIHAFEFVLTQERGKTTRLARTRQKVQRLGVAATLIDWAYGKQTDGFDMLIERGMPELCGEAIIVRHADCFPAAVVAAARQRLLDVGYDQDTSAVSSTAG